MAIVDLIVKIRDQASSGIGRIGGALSGLSGRASEAAAKTKDTTASLRDAILQADAIKFGITKAGEAYSFLNSKFEEAKNLQLEQINAATTFASLTGQSSEQASRFIEKLNDSLAKSAATLPGATQDYKQLSIAIQDNLIDAFKDPSGTLNQAGFEKTLISMSESFGALTAASTKDIGNTSLGLSKALSGASISELRQIAFFEQNPVILNALEKELAAQGKQLKELNPQARVELLEKIGKKFITDDFKKKAAESVDGLLQSFQSTLFDPSAGIFGIMRDLDPATDGVQSAFSSMNAALIEVIGPSGVFFQLSDILTAAGINLPDPMRLLKRGIDFAVGGLKQVNQGLTYIKDFVKAGGSLTDTFRLAVGMITSQSSSLSDTLTGFLPKIGERVSTFINSIAASASFVGEWAANLIDSILGFIGNRIVSFVVTADFGSVASIIGAVTSSVVNFVGGFLGSLDSGTYLTLAAGLAAAALIPPLIGAVATVATGLAAAFIAGTAGLPLLLVVAAGVAIGALAKVVIERWDDIKVAVVSFFTPIGQTIIGGLGLILGIFAADRALIIGSIKRLSEGIVGMFENAYDTLAVMLGKETLGQQRANQAAAAAEQRYQDAVAQKSLAAQPLPIAVGARYSGGIGSAAGGFLGNLITAAQKEMVNMPGGAELLVANTSETIVPQGMLGSLLKAVMPQAQNMLPPGFSGVVGSLVNSMAANNFKMPDLGTLFQAVAPQVQNVLPPEFSGIVGSLINAIAPTPAAPATPVISAAQPTPTAAPIPIATPTPVGGSRLVSGNTFNFPISIPQGVNDPAAIVQMVIEQIQQKFDEEMNGQMG